MTYSALRHMNVISPGDFNYRVDVIGCGAIGSNVAHWIAKLGVKNLHLWDFDNVEEHNLANQMFNHQDVGKNKAEVLSEAYGGEAHSTKFDFDTSLEIAFLCVDSMETRKDIVLKSIKYRPNMVLGVEIRMGLWGGHIYTLSGVDLDRLKLWEGGWYPDNESVEAITQSGSACQVSQTLGPAASIIASMAVIQMLRFWRSTKEEGFKYPEFQTLVGLNPLDLFIQ